MEKIWTKINGTMTLERFSLKESGKIYEVQRHLYSNNSYAWNIKYLDRNYYEIRDALDVILLNPKILEDLYFKYNRNEKIEKILN